MSTSSDERTDNCFHDAHEHCDGCGCRCHFSAVERAFNCASGMGYDYNFDVTDVRGALRALSAYAGIARTSPTSDRDIVVVVDSVEHGETLAGYSRARSIELVRRNCDGHVDGEHLRELLRKHEVRHDAASCQRLGCLPDRHLWRGYDLLGCFTVTPDGKQDLDDLAALMVDAGGHSFFDYTHAPKLTIDMNPMDGWRVPDGPGRTWVDAGGNVVGESGSRGECESEEAHDRNTFGECPDTEPAAGNEEQ